MSKHKFIGGTVLCAAAGLTLCGEASVRLDISGETARQTVIAEGGRADWRVTHQEAKAIAGWMIETAQRPVGSNEVAVANLPHDMKTIEPIWTSLDEPGRQQQQFVRNLKAAFGRGLDVYAVMIRRCRERGVSPWLSFRMNDIHGTRQKTDPMVSAFWKEHPEWHIGEDGSWVNGLDYAQKPVRDRMAAFIREALDRYDADGIELDFIRFPYYFRKGTERKNAPILTAFLREIRAICDAAAKRRGHPVKIAARFLPNPAKAVGMGADVGVWSKEGLLDLAIACNMYGSIEYEYHAAAWRKILTSKTQFITGTDNGIVENGKRRILNQGEYRDWIAKMRRDGADGLYFFNFPLRPYCDETWRGVLGSTACERSIDVANFVRHESPSLVYPVLADAMLASSAGTIARAANPNAVTVDFSRARGPVKPVNGVGQPPMIGALGNWSMLHYLKEAGISYSRLHDVGGWQGAGLYVDIPNLFPDFDADENDPKGYRFAYTDNLVKALVDHGVEPFFRLGVTIENFVERGMPPVRCLPPKDFAKWARICEHVIRHYTEGWANGFRYGIAYWEIWNEPVQSCGMRPSHSVRMPLAVAVRCKIV